MGGGGRPAAAAVTAVGLVVAGLDDLDGDAGGGAVPRQHGRHLAPAVAAGAVAVVLVDLRHLLRVRQ